MSSTDIKSDSLSSSVSSTVSLSSTVSSTVSSTDDKSDSHLSSPSKKPVLSHIKFNDILNANIDGLIICEGELKALSMHVLNEYLSSYRYGICALPGVWSFYEDKVAETLVKELHFMLKLCERSRNRSVYILFDSDMNTNLSVKQALMTLATRVSMYNVNVFICDLETVVEKNQRIYNRLLYKHNNKEQNSSSPSRELKIGIDDYLAESKSFEERHSMLKDVLFSSIRFVNFNKLSQMNERYCYIADIDAIYDKNIDTFYSKNGFVNLMANKEYVTYKLMNNNIVETVENLGKRWFTWKLREEYDRIVYKPGQGRTVCTDGACSLNVWFDFAKQHTLLFFKEFYAHLKQTEEIKTRTRELKKISNQIKYAIEENESYQYVNKIKEIISNNEWFYIQMKNYIEQECGAWFTVFDNIFSGKDAEREWALNWFAYPLQNQLNAKLASSIVIFSKREGVGKTMLCRSIGKIYGNSYKEIDTDTIVNNFNEWQYKNQMVLIDEVETILSSSKNTAKIKNIITSETCTINRKMMKQFVVDNTSNLMFTGNKASMLKLSDEDRRFLIVNTNAKLLDKQSYEDFVAFYDNKIHMLYMYLTYIHEIAKDYDHARVIRNRDKEEVIDISYNPVERDILDFLNNRSYYKDLIHPQRMLISSKELAEMFKIKYGHSSHTSYSLGRALNNLGMKIVNDGKYIINHLGNSNKYYIMSRDPNVIARFNTLGIQELKKHIEHFKGSIEI